MSYKLYICFDCACIETTRGNPRYWFNLWAGRKILCSECDPEVKKWHGMFKKRRATGFMLGNDMLLYSKKWIHTPKMYLMQKFEDVKIIGEIQ